MIRFKKIRYKNFLSSGNHFTEIDFQKSNTTLIIGSNGSGKSTVLDALTFSLFGKPFRKITKTQLVNSVNERDAKVEIEFNARGIEYKVVRGIKPNLFEIFKEGRKTNEDASANDQQKTLEGQILKLNYKSFTQIVILGSASFVPFMQLSAPHRREVIEDLLDIKIFSSMSDILKQKLKVSNDALRTLELKRESAADKIVMQERFIKSIEKASQDEIESKQQKIAYLEKESESFEKRIMDLKTDVETKEKAMAEYSTSGNTVKSLDKIKTKIKFKRDHATDEMNFFVNHDVCPSCTQSIQESIRNDKVDTLKKTIDKYTGNINEVQQAYDAEEQNYATYLGYQKDITELKNEISKQNIQLSTTTKLKQTIETEIQDIAYKVENRNAEDDKLTEYKNNLRQILRDLQTTKEENQYQQQCRDLLKDDGVKSSIIRKYLPIINKQVNFYLQKMDFYINFTLDEEFNENIVSPAHDRFTYASFSEGEKMRIDLALLFTWREIAKNYKNSVNTNLLIMDEVFDSSLDGFGTDEFLKIVRFVIKDSNTFIISHKNELYDKFHDCLEFVKVKGFSQLKGLT